MNYGKCSALQEAVWAHSANGLQNILNSSRQSMAVTPERRKTAANATKAGKCCAGVIAGEGVLGGWVLRSRI